MNKPSWCDGRVEPVDEPPSGAAAGVGEDINRLLAGSSFYNHRISIFHSVQVVICKHGRYIYICDNEFTSVYSNPGEMAAVIPPSSASVSAEVNDLG